MSVSQAVLCFQYLNHGHVRVVRMRSENLEPVADGLAILCLDRWEIALRSLRVVVHVGQCIRTEMQSFPARMTVAPKPTVSGPVQPGGSRDHGEWPAIHLL